MASIIKTALQDVLLQARSVSGVQYAAVFNNQIIQEQDGKTFDFPKPAILIEIDTPNTGLQTLGTDNVTVSELTWRLSIVHEQLDAGDGTLDQNLDVFDYRDLVKVAFTSFRPTNCSYWQYSEESQDYAHNNIYVYGISFKCSFVDTKGSPLDPDSTVYITKVPPIALDLQAYITTPQPPATRIAYGWKVCEIVAYIVDVVDPLQTQQLGNGDIIPLQYLLNIDGTVTIPELATYTGIVALAAFLIDNQLFDDYISIDYSTGKITNSGGGFIVGNIIRFNASLPLYTPA
jgi:hypothetical protein